MAEVTWEAMRSVSGSATGDTNSSGLGAGTEQQVLEVSSRCLLQSAERDFREAENQSSLQPFGEIGLCSSGRSTERSHWTRRKERGGVSAPPVFI